MASKAAKDKYHFSPNARIFPELVDASGNEPSQDTASSKSTPSLLDKGQNPPDPMQKLPVYHQMFSRSRKNGVFLLSQKGTWLAHDNKPGPVGWDLKNHPMGGASFEGLIGFGNVWETSQAYITYAEASPETEEAWLALKFHPVADRTLAGFLAQLVKVSKSHSNPKAQKLAAGILKDMKLEEDFIVNMNKHAKGRRLRPKDENKLALIINNPSRGGLV